ncbi:MAG: hypothetical protein IPI58_06440 [Alphaproteobacteria bacterium]|nr:MAG: hypothetical protein IPI58_06440 [Alphaproteobacteria bacterium]
MNNGLPPRPGSPSQVRIATPQARPSKPDTHTLLSWTAVGLCGLWLALAAIYVARAPSSSLTLPFLSAAVSLILSPMAMVWLVLAFFMRANDVRDAIEPLRRQLNVVLGGQGQAIQRLRAFTDNLEQQLELFEQIAEASQRRSHEALEHLRHQVKDIAQLGETSRKSLLDVVAEMDIRTQNTAAQLGDIEHRLQSQLGALDALSTGLHERGQSVTTDVERVTAALAQTMDSRLERCNEMAKNISMREAALLNAARTVAGHLQEATQTVEQGAGGFIERSSAIEQILSRGLSALQSQADTLERVGTTFGARLSESTQTVENIGENLLRSEAQVAERVVSLGINLDERLAGLESTVSAFGERSLTAAGQLQRRLSDYAEVAAQMRDQLGKVEDGFERRQESLQSLVARAADSVGQLGTQIEQAMGGLAQRTTETLRHYADTVRQANTQGEALATQLGGSAERLAATLQSTGDSLRQTQQGLDKQLGPLESILVRLTEGSENVGTSAQQASDKLQPLLESLATLRAMIDMSCNQLAERLGESLTAARRQAGAWSDDARQAVVNLTEVGATTQIQLTQLFEGLRQAQTEMREAAQTVNVTGQKMQDTLQIRTQNLRTDLDALAQSLGGADQTLARLSSFDGKMVTHVQALNDLAYRLTEDGSKAKDGANAALSDWQRLHDSFSILEPRQQELRDLLQHADERLQAWLSGIETLQLRHLQAQDGAEDKVSRITASLGETLSRLAAMREEVAHNVMGLDQAGESFGGVLHRLGLALGEIDSHRATLETGAGDWQMRLNDVLGGVRDSFVKLSDLQDGVTRSAREIGAMINDAGSQAQTQANQLALRARQAEEALRLASESCGTREAELVGQIGQIEDRLRATLRAASDLGQAFDGIHRSARDQGEAWITHMQSGAQRLAEMQQQLVEHREKAQTEAEHVQSLAQTSQGALASLGHDLRDKVEVLQNLQSELDNTAVRVRDSVAGALERMDDIRARAEASRTAINEIDVSGIQAGEHVASLAERLGTTQNVALQLVQILRDDGGRAASEVEELAQRHATALRSVFDQAAQSSGWLRESIGQTLAEAERMGTQLGSSAAAAATRLQEEVERLAKMSEQSNQVFDQWRQGVEGQIGSLTEALDRLAAERGKLGEGAQDANATITALSDKFVGVRDLVASGMGQVGERLGEETQSMQQNMMRLAQKAGEVRDELRRVGGDVDAQAQALVQSAQRAEGQILVATAGIKQQTDSVRGNIQQNIEQLMGALNGTLSNFESMREGLRHQARVALEDVSAFAAGFKAASTGFGEQINGSLTRLNDIKAGIDGLQALELRFDSSRSLARDVSEDAITRLSDMSQVLERRLDQTRASLQSHEDAFAASLSGMLVRLEDSLSRLREATVVTAEAERRKSA